MCYNHWDSIVFVGDTFIAICWSNSLIACVRKAICAPVIATETVSRLRRGGTHSDANTIRHHFWGGTRSGVSRFAWGNVAGHETVDQLHDRSQRFVYSPTKTSWMNTVTMAPTKKTHVFTLNQIRTINCNHRHSKYQSISTNTDWDNRGVLITYISN